MEHKYREIYALLKTPKIKLTPHIISLMLEFYGLDDEYELTEEMIEFSQIGLNKRLSKMTSDIKDAEQPAKMVLSRINSMKLTILYINNPRVIENITARIDLLEILYNEKYKEISPAVQHAKDILHKSMHALAKIKVIMQAHGVNFRQGGSHAFLYGRQNELNAKRFIIRKYGKNYNRGQN
jgi:hypothetical protein